MTSHLTISPTTNSRIPPSTAPNSLDYISINTSGQYHLQASDKTSLYQDMQRVLRDDGEVRLQEDMTDEEQMGFLLNGFEMVNQRLVKKMPQKLVGAKMNLSNGASVDDTKNNSANQQKAKWTLDVNDDNVFGGNDEDDEMIDEDDLLEDEDLAKPVVPTEADCNPEGRRKACKNCSCGRAEKEEEEEKLTRKAKMELIKQGVVTGCGSCGMGDAFRCDSCPFLGMPKFVPGQENGNVVLDLTDDI